MSAAAAARAAAKAGVKEAGTAQAAVSIDLKDIVQEYPAPGGGVTRVVDGVNLAFERPGINMLLGPSGCGKSTILHMLGGIRPMGEKTPTSGKVLIDGVECNGPHDDSVMVFQRYANRPDLDVFDNVALFSSRRLRGEAEQHKRVADTLKAVGLAEKRAAPGTALGGQNQRVALARAGVAAAHPVMTNLSARSTRNAREMQRLLIELWRAALPGRVRHPRHSQRRWYSATASSCSRHSRRASPTHVITERQ